MECLTFALALLGAGALLVAWRAHSRLAKLERSASAEFLERRDLARKIDALRAEVARMAAQARAPDVVDEHPASPAEEAPILAQAAANERELEVAPADAPYVAGDLESQPDTEHAGGSDDAPALGTGRADDEPLADAEPAFPSEEPPVPTPSPEPLAAPLGPPSPPAAVPTPAAGAAASARRTGSRAFDWESLVGVRLFSWIAGIALVLAALFFLRYSIDQGWLTAPVRMSLGLATGLGLLIGCELKAARRYPVTANALDAAGVAILYATSWAAHAAWNLVGAVTAFGFLALVTAVAVLLSIRRSSVFIALLGLVGGFASPALLVMGEDRTISLFGYLLLLNAGLAWVAYRRRWPILTGLSLLFTTLYQAGWVLKYLGESRLPLAAAIFLAFPALGIGSLLLDDRRSRDVSDTEPAKRPHWFARVALVGALVPLIFVMLLAAVPAYGAHVALLFGLLGILVLGLFLIAATRGPEEMHLLGATATIIVFGVWLRMSYTPALWPLVLALLSPFVIFLLGAPMLASWIKRPFRAAAERSDVFGALLFFAFPAIIALEPATARPWLLFLTILALLAWAAFVAVQRSGGLVYYLAAGGAVAAEVAWSALRLTPERRYSAMAIYALLALFYLGVPALAQRRRAALAPAAGTATLLLASLALLLFLTRTSIAPGSLLGLTVLLLLLNAGLLAEIRAGRAQMHALLGGLITWVVLGFWWHAVPLAQHRLSALLSLALVSLFLTAVGTALLQEMLPQRDRRGSDEASVPDIAPWLGLGGHLFLLWMAGQPSLSLPAIPLLAVLFVLNLALIVAALHARRGWLALAALAASQIVLSLALGAAPRSAWPQIALASALAVAVLGTGAWLLAERMRARTSDNFGSGFLIGAVASILLGFWVAIHGSAQAGAPAFYAVLASEAALLVALLWVGARAGRVFVALLAVVPAVLAVAVYQGWHPDPQLWGRELVLAGVLWGILLAYSLLLGEPASGKRGPYFAAIAAGAGFFVTGRSAMLRGQLGAVIGLLPVVQAALLTPLLVRLVRIERTGERDLTRLASVAGSILAFVTVAIPMQLEKQWVTVGWSLLGAALVWLYRRVPHIGLLWWAAGLEAAVFVRLALNPAVLAYHPRSGMPIFNWFLYTYLIAAASMLFAGWKLGSTARPPWLRAAFVAAGTVLLFLLLNIEIADYFSTGSTITFGFLAGSAGLSEDLAYTIGWALFAIGLLAAGLLAGRRSVRLCAIVLLVATILKAFLHDTWRLGGLYRVGSLVGLAVCLALVAVVLQKFVLTPREAREGDPS